MAPPITPIGTTIKWNAAVVVGAKRITPTYGATQFIRSGSDLSGAAESVFASHNARGSVSFEFDHDPDDTVHKALATDKAAKTQRAVVITFADTAPVATLSANGIIETLDIPIDQSAPLRSTCVIQLVDEWVAA